MLKLNVGCGRHKIPGWTSVDRLFGREAYPLDFPDNSADEILASHVLEHFHIDDVEDALADWVRVLKPGKSICIAVPDLDYIFAESKEPKEPNPHIWMRWLMGGQTDENDDHHSVFNENILRMLMEEAGLINIRRWECIDKNCTAILPVSLNLMGEKA